MCSKLLICFSFGVKMAAATEMEDLERRWLASVKKNMDIEYECRVMEARIAAMGGDVEKYAASNEER